MSGLWQVGTVTTVGPQTLTLMARVDATTARTNTASISQSDQFDPDTNNNSASATETPQAANLALAKTVDDPTPNVGDTITFTVTLSDLGPDAATSVTVNDALPAGLFFLSATPSQGIYAPMSGLWQVGTVTTAGPQTLTLKARVDATTARTNTASISQSDQFDPDTNNNSASATETPQVANLALAKTVDDPTPHVGDTITFTVTLSDLGPDAATSVTVQQRLRHRDPDANRCYLCFGERKQELQGRRPALADGIRGRATRLPRLPLSPPFLASDHALADRSHGLRLGSLIPVARRRCEARRRVPLSDQGRPP
jgi:uncharacterized repeat protein (TIGR01451 family)